MLTTLAAHWLAFALAGWTAVRSIDPLMFIAIPATYAMVADTTRRELARGL
jgi:hypothetical protein